MRLVEAEVISKFSPHNQLLQESINCLQITARNRIITSCQIKVISIITIQGRKKKCNTRRNELVACCGLVDCYSTKINGKKQLSKIQIYKPEEMSFAAYVLPEHNAEQISVQNANRETDQKAQQALTGHSVLWNNFLIFSSRIHFYFPSTSPLQPFLLAHTNVLQEPQLLS